MKSFFKTLFASTLGVIIGGFLFLLIVIISIGAISGGSSYTLEDKTILKLELDGAISEQKESNPLNFLLGGSNTLGLDDILDAIKKATENNEIKGIYIKINGSLSGISNTDAIRNALIDFKKSGKFVIAYSDVYSQSGYYLSSVADKIIMNPKGMLEFQGLSANLRFSKNFFDKLGVKFQVFKVGTFKSAVEPYIQEKMSEPNRLQVSSYLNDVWSHILKGISESRNIPIDQLNNYADKFLLFSEADSIVKYKMVDTLMYEPAVNEYLKNLSGIEKDDELKTASIENLKSIKFKTKEDSDNKIAVLYAEGVIVEENNGGLLFSEKSITSKQFVEELTKLKDDEDIKAVVFRVNSRGGSAYASEQIWNAVMELKAKKPVVVSMGDYAASGGYYISCGANAIVAEPTTLTGSIGIFGLIPNGEELAQKIGYTFDEVNTNKHSSFGGSGFSIPFLISAYSRGFNEEESKMLQGFVEKGYDLFIGRCANGRSKTKAEIDSIGQGRVWTGNQALKLGLVDKLGGVNDALKIAAEKANLTTYSIAKYPEEDKSFFSQILNKSVGKAKIKIAKLITDDEEYQRQLMMQELKNLDFRMAEMPDYIKF